MRHTADYTFCSRQHLTFYGHNLIIPDSRWEIVWRQLRHWQRRDHPILRLQSQCSIFKSLITKMWSKLESFRDRAKRKLCHCKAIKGKKQLITDNYFSSTSHWLNLKKHLETNLIKVLAPVLLVSRLQVPLRYCQNYSGTPEKGRMHFIIRLLK